MGGGGGGETNNKFYRSSTDSLAFYLQDANFAIVFFFESHLHYSTFSPPFQMRPSGWGSKRCLTAGRTKEMKVSPKMTVIVTKWKDEWQDVISYGLLSMKVCSKVTVIATEWKDEDEMLSHTQYSQENENMYWLLGNEKMNDKMLSYSHTHCVLHSVCDEMRRWMTRCHLIHSICEEMKRCIDC